MAKVYMKSMDGDPLSAKVRELVAYWLDSPEHLEHCPALPILRRWEGVINTWVSDARYPLLVRRGATTSGGQRQVHAATGRALTACDNSPAEWIFRLALAGTVLTAEEMLRRLTDRSLPRVQKLPVNRFLGAHDETDTLCEYTGSFNQLPTFADENYHVAHIVGIGMDKKGEITDLPMSMLMLHSRRLLSPANIVLVRSDLKGIAEFACFPSEVLAWRRRRGIPVPAWLVGKGGGRSHRGSSV
jgi:hypothetical protein